MPRRCNTLPPNGFALKLRAACPQGASLLNDSSCAPAHKTLIPLRAIGPPASGAC